MLGLLKQAEAAVIIEPRLRRWWSVYFYMIITLPGMRLNYQTTPVKRTSTHMREALWEGRKVVSFLAFLCRKVIRALMHEDNLISETKRDCHMARTLALTRGKWPNIWRLIPKGLGYQPGWRAYAQASMLSRSLPEPSGPGNAPALQMERLTTPSAVITPRDRLSLGKFALATCGKIVPVYRPQFTSTGASFETTRKLGGKGAALAALYKTSEKVEVKENFGPPGTTMFGACSTIYHVAGATLGSLPYHLDSKAIPVLERGSKVRMVSCSDPIRSMRSDAYRRVLFKRLHKLRPCRAALAGEPTKLTFRDVSRGAIVYSADLSAATDNLSWDAIASVCKATDIPFDLVAGGTLDGVEMKRGTLMGIPLSWPILSLIHVWAVWRMNIPFGTFHIKGDDLIALWTIEEIAFYETHLPKLTGMLINHDKTMIGPETGVFCERFFHRRGNGALTIIREVFSLKPLTTPTRTGEYPPELALAEFLWSLKDRVAWPLLYKLYKVYMGPRITSVKSVGPIGYLPAFMGGLSRLPADPEGVVPRWISRLMTAIHDGRGSVMVRGLVVALRNYYKPGTVERFVADGIGREVLNLKVEYARTGHLPGVEYFLHHMRELLSTYAATLNLPRSGLSYSSYLTYLRKVAKRNKKTVRPTGERLTEWHYAGIRPMMAQLGPSAISFDKAPEEAREWFEGICLHNHDDLPTRLGGESHLEVGSLGRRPKE
jgi:hypothetical protein